MTKMKKFGALLLALVLVLSLSAPAFADADMTGEAGVIGEFETKDKATVQDKKVVIYKEITAYNPETCEVNAPEITFGYTIVAGDAGKTVKDNGSHHTTNTGVEVVTKAGVGNPTITGTDTGVLELNTANKLEASAKGTANRFALTVDFSSVDFTTAGTGAGVYRYVINETTTEATKNASGIKEGEVANTLYLDVYVDGAGAIYGYVLFTNNDTIDGSTSDATASTAAGKTEGFVGGKADKQTYENATDSKADKYYTFNLAITKVVENDNYAKTTHHQFPFTVTLENASVTANVLPIMTVSANATQTTLTAAPIARTWNPTIADGASVTYVGIPCGTTVTIKEKNNIFGVTYSAAITGADTNGDTKYINYNEESNNAVVNCGATPLAAAKENHNEVTFTNTLIQISPTGVVLRIAPYALMLSAGIVLFVLSRKRKAAEEEA